MDWTVITRGATLFFLALAVILNAFAPDVGHLAKLFADGAAAATALSALFMHPPWSASGSGGAQQPANPPPPPAAQA